MYNDMNQNQYPNQGQFQNQYQYQYPQQPPESPGFGVASMVLGIISLCLSCCAYFISIPCAIVGIILGLIGLKKQAGRGMATAGLVCSYYIIYSRDYSYINWSINSFVVKKFLM